MGTTQQLALVAVLDPILYRSPEAQTSLSTVLTSLCQPRLSSVTFGRYWDEACALLAIHTIRCQNPNVGGGETVSYGDPVSGEARKTTKNVPAGLPADWGSTPAGIRLIGLLQSCSPPVCG